MKGLFYNVTPVKKDTIAVSVPVDVRKSWHHIFKETTDIFFRVLKKRIKDVSVKTEHHLFTLEKKDFWIISDKFGGKIGKVHFSPGKKFQARLKDRYGNSSFKRSFRSIFINIYPYENIHPGLGRFYNPNVRDKLADDLKEYIIRVD